MWTTATRYGIQALLHLASRPANGSVKVREMADELGVSQSYLAKILQELAAKDFVETRRGPSGGVRLAVPPESISINAVVAALEGVGPMSRCLLRDAECSSENPCALHGGWSQVREVFDREVGTLDLASLAFRIDGATVTHPANF
jgi:Rrf2 family protein